MRDFSTVERIVVKLGTNILSRNGALDTAYLAGIAGQTAALKADGRKLLLVTSGAIGMGAGELGITEKITSIRMRQACAAIGQPLLMHEYRRAFKAHGMTIAQILLTREVLNNRRSYLNLRTSVETLLDLDIVPIFNENDSISTAEIGNAFGDNDRLSALVASKVEAQLLIILTDIDALYDSDPRENPDAKPISTVEQVTKEILACAGAAGSTFSTGGMKTKVLAAEIAEKAGCRMLLADGREDRVLERLLAGEPLGTVFLARERLSARTRWILNSLPHGEVVVDQGAVDALRRGKSLLPSGIKDVRGVFAAGDVISLVSDGTSVGRLVVGFNSSELRSLMGRHSSEIRSLLGCDRRDVVARPEDIVMADV